MSFTHCDTCDTPWTAHATACASSPGIGSVLVARNSRISALEAEVKRLKAENAVQAQSLAYAYAMPEGERRDIAYEGKIAGLESRLAAARAALAPLAGLSTRNHRGDELPDETPLLVVQGCDIRHCRPGFITVGHVRAAQKARGE